MHSPSITRGWSLCEPLCAFFFPLGFKCSRLLVEKNLCYWRVGAGQGPEKSFHALLAHVLVRQTGTKMGLEKQASSGSSRMLRILLEEAGIEEGWSEKRPDLSRVHKHEDVVA